MNISNTHKLLPILFATSLLSSAVTGSAFAASSTSTMPSYTMTKIAGYQAGQPNEEGGVAEIIKYNPDNQMFYLVNGQSQKVELVSLSKLSGKDSTALQATKKLDVSSLIPGFAAGDVTSIDVNTKQKLIAVAVQAKVYDANGAILLLDYDGNYVSHIETGVQPDMVCFSSDGSYVLSANEGEPREGYADGAVDPLGSVTIADISQGAAQAKSKTIDFKAYDNKREQLIADQVILKKGAAPSADLEPEYITIANGKAYVSLQEANAIATIDISSGEVLSIKGLGFKDHSQVGNELDMYRDGKIGIKSEAKVYGMYMPDGIASYTANSKTYIVTANEGDSRAWGDYTNELELKLADGGQDGKKDKAIKVTALDPKSSDGNFNAGATYLFGARSFAIWNADDMSLVYDSGSDMEQITARELPDYFNWSNDDDVMDKRSAKKGPEPEDVKIGVIEGKPYAFIGIERTGGVMMYDVTNPQAPVFEDYSNTRDFSSKIAGDVAPEGLHFISQGESPIGLPLLLVGNEVSGTASVLKIEKPAAESPAPSAAPLTRSDFVTLLGQLAGVDAASYPKVAFNDVPADASYAPYVAWAKANAITTGVHAGSFAPHEVITREQMAIMLVRFADAQSYTLPQQADAVSYTDQAGISAYAKPAITRLQQAGISIARDEQTFGPQDSITQADLVQLLQAIKG